MVPVQSPEETESQEPHQPQPVQLMFAVCQQTSEKNNNKKTHKMALYSSSGVFAVAAKLKLLACKPHNEYFGLEKGINDVF